MIDFDFAWPSDEMNFWNVSNEEYLVRVSWSKNHFENYKNLSYSYYQCGYKTILEIVQNSDNNLKTDMWFLASIFLLRQSIELGLKAIICRESEKTRNIFKVHLKNANMIFRY